MNDENRPSLREEMDELKSKIMSMEMTCQILVERLNRLECLPIIIEDLIKENENQ